ncbi:MAG TPA: S-layer homology domain-containing protein, partial [Clostridia bacterium]|nr:S-layer homology domain-containing protein [Clostridia bacterium]
MFRGKKLLSILLVGLLVMGALMPVALADPPSFAQNKKGQVKKELKLKDIKGHWAESIMMEMYSKGFIQGYEDLSFRPGNVVSNLETVVMLVRALGWEEEAKKAGLTANFKHGKQVPSWAQGYLQIAYEKGLLEDGDLKSFRPNQGTKRIEVAVFLARILGLDKGSGKDVVLSFFDTRDIANDLKEIISIMVNKGIMQGVPGNLFQPNKPITRAEMAVLLDRIDGKIGDINLPEISGVITAIGDETISLKTGSYTQKFLLDKKVTVYLDGKLADIDDIDVGYRAKLVFGDGGKVIYIKANSTKDEQIYRGKIVQMVLGLDAGITLKDGTKTHQFKVNSNTEVEVDGKEVFLADLKIGQEVTVIAQGDLALVISSGKVKEKSVEGVLTEVSLGKTNTIKVKDEDGKETRLQVTDETRI